MLDDGRAADSERRAFGLEPADRFGFDDEPRPRNPTLTIVALATRQADHIAGAMGRHEI